MGIASLEFASKTMKGKEMKKELAEWIWYFFLDVEAKAVAEKTAAAQTKTEKFQKMKKEALHHQQVETRSRYLEEEIASEAKQVTV